MVTTQEQRAPRPPRGGSDSNPDRMRTVLGSAATNPRPNQHRDLADPRTQSPQPKPPTRPLELGRHSYRCSWVGAVPDPRQTVPALSTVTTQEQRAPRPPRGGSDSNPDRMRTVLGSATTTLARTSTVTSLTQEHTHPNQSPPRGIEAGPSALRQLVARAHLTVVNDI